MSSMGELTFFLGLQVKQKADGIFISQDKYVAEILKKFDFANVKTASTPIETQNAFSQDEKPSDVDVHALIGFRSLKSPSHLSAVKRIFRYLKGKPKLGLWYPRVSSFDLESYSDSDMAAGNLDRNPNRRGLIEFRESLRRVTDGTEALLIPTLFILWLDKVSTDSANSLRNLSQIHSYLQALISLLTTITLSTTMAVLEFQCPKHNMVAYLEKSEGNAEFHEIIDFLKRSSIHHALTVSPVVSTTFVEQFWTSANSKSTSWDQIPTNIATGLGYNAVPPPYTGNFMPPKTDLVYPSLYDFMEVNESVSKSIVEKPTIESNEPKTARKENGAPIIKD
ncbi:uncharacterized mitochondrial protein-like protein [Tanacetum coccineum]